MTFFANDFCGNSVQINYNVIDNKISEVTSNLLDKNKKSFLQFIQAAFLPEGYPDSVSEDYWEYQKWDSIQAFCSSITGLLATQAILTGVGVGDATATSTSALIQVLDSKRWYWKNRKNYLCMVPRYKFRL
jgi:hypothetical protein